MLLNIIHDIKCCYSFEYILKISMNFPVQSNSYTLWKGLKTQ